MPTVNPKSGFGGLWPKPSQRPAPGGGTAKPAGGGDSLSLSSSANRLAQLAGGPVPAVGAQTATDLVKQSADLKTLVRKALKRSVGRDVNLGGHEDALLQYVQNGLAASNLDFDDVKRKLS
ncbi:MAG: hypothetical protein KGR26_16950 [Cyanobacteria bacterium REEB65]|nr:hypothetical protein [Cyanobacteria bacterium REEB65]